MIFRHPEITHEDVKYYINHSLMYDVSIKRGNSPVKNFGVANLNSLIYQSFNRAASRQVQQNFQPPPNPKVYKKYFKSELVQSVLGLSNMDYQMLKELAKLRNTEWFFECQTLSQGDSLGDLALLNSKPRSATIKCKTNCILGMLSSHDYHRLFGAIARMEQNLKIKFFEEMPLLRHWGRDKIKDLLPSFIKKDFTTGQLVFK